MQVCGAVLASLLLCAPLAGADSTAGAPRTLKLTSIPPRPTDGVTGSQFARQTEGWPEPERQRAALAELERGNVPRSLTELWPIELRYQPPAGDAITATIWVTPDYVALGRDDDFLYMPLAWPAATGVAERFGCVLPTRKMVDAIYRQAPVHLEPRPLPAGPQMRSNAYALRHQQLIDAQRAGVPLSELIAGHKKDVVLSNRLFALPDRVAIYGWHRLDGQPIQPLSTVHGARYADYSHGVRLVWNQVWIDGVPHSIYDVLADPALAPLLSDEGAIRDPRGLLDPVRASIAAAPTFAASARR